MKKICMILIALGIIMGYAPATATADTQKTGQTEDTVKVFTSIAVGSDIECEINQRYYLISSTRKYAVAVGGVTEGPVLEIPDSIVFQGVSYPVTKFDNTINHSGPRTKEHEEIKLPDSILEMKFAGWCYKKINIPKHAKILSLSIDIDDINLIIPEDHDYYRVKDNFVYDKQDSRKIYYVLGASGNVQIPEGVEYVGELLENSKIKTISLPSTLKEIGINFAEWTAMKTIDLSKTKLKEIPQGAFLDSKLQSVKLPRSLRSIGKIAFASSKLKKVTIPDKVTRIRHGAFSGCHKLQKIILGKRVEKIAADAFTMTAIKEITFPASVKIIYSSALSNDKKLQKVTFLHKKGLPQFSGNKPIIQYVYMKPDNKKITFCVRNPKMKSSLKKKIKKEKLKSKKSEIPGINKWKIKVV